MADPEADLVEMVTWIEKSEYKRAQEKAFGASSTITGIKGDLTLMKGEIAGLALGMTAVKVDFTLLKVDEKGVSWRGRQLVGFKFADEAKSFQAAMERKQRKLGRAQQKIQRRLDKFETAQLRRSEALTRNAGASQELSAAQRRVRGANFTAADIDRFLEAERAAKRAENELERFEKKYDKAKRKATGIRDWADEIKTKISDLNTASEDAKKKFKNVAAEGETKLESLRTALDRASQAA